MDRAPAEGGVRRVAGGEASPRQAPVKSVQTKEEQDMSIGTFIRGAAIGAAAMYFFDPQRGQARREMAQAKLQQLGEAWNRSEERRVGKECRCRWSAYH